MGGSDCTEQPVHSDLGAPETAAPGVTDGNIVSLQHTVQQHSDPQQGGNGHLRDVFTAVMRAGKYNFAGARRTIPSGLKTEAWRRLLRGYPDYHIVDYLQFD